MPGTEMNPSAAWFELVHGLPINEVLALLVAPRLP